MGLRSLVHTDWLTKCANMVNGWLMSSCPAIAGKGDHPAKQGGGRGGGLDTPQTNQGYLRGEASIVLRRQRSFEPGAPSHGSLASRAPVVPLPRFAGAVCARALVLATHTRPRFADQSHKHSPQNNEGRRSAEKARLSRGASPRIGCRHPSALRAGPRVQRNALAFGAPPRLSLRPIAEARCRPRFTRCSAKALPAPWHRA